MTAVDADPWRCWRRGGSHSYVLTARPNAGVNKAPATRDGMEKRLNAFVNRYADVCVDAAKSERVRMLSVPVIGRAPWSY